MNSMVKIVPIRAYVGSPLFELMDTKETVGASRSSVIVLEVSITFPAASFTRRYTVCSPSISESAKVVGAAP